MKKIYYFMAPWCGMCRALKPKFTDECNRLGLKEGVDYEFVNAEDREDIALEYGIRNLPTLVFTKDGVIAGKAFGVNAWEELKKYYGND